MCCRIVLPSVTVTPLVRLSLPDLLTQMAFKTSELYSSTAIAEALCGMDSEVAASEQRREKTRALKQAMMQELLTRWTRLV